jgi:hypothetical protein
MASNYPNSGSLFKNDRKSEERQADQTGSGEITCPHCGAVTEMWISGWFRTARKTGNRFLSLAFQAKDASPKKRTMDPPANFDDDNIPF